MELFQIRRGARKLLSHIQWWKEELITPKLKRMLDLNPAWWEEYKHPETMFTSTIHDEINASAPEEIWREEMAMLRHAMDQDYFDAPMRSEGSYGPNWGNLTELTREEDYG